MSTNRSRTDFLRFLDYLGEKGLIPSATAASRKATANKVMAILSDEEAQDVTIVDLDLLMRRFHNLNGQQYTPESLQTYSSRMRTALSDFRAYCESPVTFRPSRAFKLKPKGNGEKTSPSTVKTATPDVTLSVTQVPSALPNVSVLPVAIRADVVVQVVGIPFDLTKGEAQKIANIILAHASVD